jgi:ubiquinone/menaquinone biosynthesis C-methylase UbiE
MEPHELVALIKNGVPSPNGIWAELGAGGGNFTHALRSLLAPTSTIYAIDRDPRAIREQQERLARNPDGATIILRQGDFTVPLDLPPLNGVLMANTLHFVRDQEPTLRQIRSYLKPGGTLLLVEYDFRVPRPWVPHPIAAQRFAALVTSAGFVDPTPIATRHSPTSGASMYSATARRAG